VTPKVHPKFSAVSVTSHWMIFRHHWQGESHEDEKHEKGLVGEEGGSSIEERGSGHLQAVVGEGAIQGTKVGNKHA
jgi:hypothetical protein